MTKKIKHTGNWQGGKITKDCEYCGSIFFIWKHRRNTARFCSRNCHHKSRVGKLAWNSGKPQPQTAGERSPGWKGGKPHCNICGVLLASYYAKVCIKHREKMPENLGVGMLDKKHSQETIEKMRQARLKNPSGGAGRVGELNNNWKGGITPLVEAIRRLGEYKNWRSSCLRGYNSVKLLEFLKQTV